MKEEITSSEYWDLPAAEQSKYQRIALVFNGAIWVERTVFGSENVKIKVVYRLKHNTTFSVMGMGTF